MKLLKYLKTLITLIFILLLFAIFNLKLAWAKQKLSIHNKGWELNFENTQSKSHQRRRR